MRHVPTVAWRELRSLFVSPVAYGVLSLFAVLAGLFFLIELSAFQMNLMYMQQMQMLEQFERMNLNDHVIGSFYDSMGLVLLFLVPAVTMGLFTQEKTSGTQELLMTSPLTMWDIVLGKFVASAAFLTIMVAMLGAYPALLFAYGDPELGKTLTGLAGMLLVAWTYVAIGTFASSITRSQIVAFLIALVVLLLILLLPVVAALGIAGGGGASDALRWLGTMEHLQPLKEGLVDTADLVYFVVVIGSFLLMTKLAVESVRWR
jgi:ABC-2 type transport system permease protein